MVLHFNLLIVSFPLNELRVYMINFDNSTKVPYLSLNLKVYVINLQQTSQPVEEIDKIQWFLCWLGASFEAFSIAIGASKPGPVFNDLISQAESNELFLKSLYGFTTSTPTAAFSAEQSQSRQIPSPQHLVPYAQRLSQNHIYIYIFRFTLYENTSVMHKYNIQDRIFLKNFLSANSIYSTTKSKFIPDSQQNFLVLR